MDSEEDILESYPEVERRAAQTGEGYFTQKLLYTCGLRSKKPLLDVQREQTDAYLKKIGWTEADYKSKNPLSR